MGLYTNINIQSSQTGPGGGASLYMLLAEPKWDEAAITALLQQGVDIKAQNEEGVSCIELFNKRLNSEFIQFEGELEKLAIENKTDKRKADALKEIKNAVPNLKNQLRKDLRNNRLGMQEALTIKSAAAQLFAAIISNNLKEEDVTNFKNVTASLKTRHEWSTIIGAIIGAVSVLLIIGGLVWSGVGIPLLLAAGTTIAGALVGASLGFWSSKNSVKQINSNISPLLFVPPKQIELKEEVALSDNLYKNYSPEQIDYHKKLTREVNSFIGSLDEKTNGKSRKNARTTSLLYKFQETALLLKRNVDSGQIFTLKDRSQNWTYMRMMEAVHEKLKDNVFNIKLSSFEMQCRSLYIDYFVASRQLPDTAKKSGKISLPKNHKVFVKCLKNKYLLESDGLRAEISLGEFIQFAHKRKQYSFDKFIELDDCEYKDLIKILDKNNNFLIRDVTGEDEAKAAEEKAAALLQQEKLHLAWTDFLVGYSNKIELMIFKYDLDQEYQMPQPYLSSLWHGKKEIFKEQDMLARDKYKILHQNLVMLISQKNRALSDLPAQIIEARKICNQGIWAGWSSNIHELSLLISEFKPMIELILKYDQVLNRRTNNEEQKENLSQTLIPIKLS